jgi:hypothetical protein
MEYIHQPELFMASILENTPQTIKYRRQTVFVGILTESEREETLETIIFQ